MDNEPFRIICPKCKKEEVELNFGGYELGGHLTITCNDCGHIYEKES